VFGRRRKRRILRQRGRQITDFLLYPSSVPSAYDSSVLAGSGAIQIVTRGQSALFPMHCLSADRASGSEASQSAFAG